MTNHTPAAKGGSQENPAVGVVRQTVDLVVVLCLGVLMFRTFSAEAYVVPTGSMAPTLMGHHRELTCPNCGFVFVIGVDEEGHPPRPVCPNCGKNDLDRTTAVECNGDRVLVQKFLYDFRAPRRWEVAVFHFPGEPSQAYVKRVVGLPGESVQIVGGNVQINGRVARKSLDELARCRSWCMTAAIFLRIPTGFPRWVFRRGEPRHRLASGWSQSAGTFVHEPVKPEPHEPDQLAGLAGLPALGSRAQSVRADPRPLCLQRRRSGCRERGSRPVARGKADHRLGSRDDCHHDSVRRRSVRGAGSGQGQRARSRWLETITSSSWSPGRHPWPRSTAGRARSCSRPRSSTTGLP